MKKVRSRCLVTVTTDLNFDLLFWLLFVLVLRFSTVQVVISRIGF